MLGFVFAVLKHLFEKIFKVSLDVDKHVAEYIAHHYKAVLVGFILILVFGGVLLKTLLLLDKWDDAPDRGAQILSENQFGDHYEKIYSGLTKDDDGHDVSWQGWGPEDSMWFYSTTQGSDLIPYDFFMVLQQKNSDELFRSNENMDRYRYIPQKSTFSNPDGLALGFVKDTYQGKDFVGLTCAACHTAQINYDGVAMRIDGGPAMADMEYFVNDISAAMTDTITNPKKEKRFVEAVMERNDFVQIISGGRNYSSEDDVKKDMNKYAARLLDYITINHSNLAYGYGRLDGFGRIFNRVLQHVLNKKLMRSALLKVMSADEVEKVLTGISGGVVVGNSFDRIVKNVRPLLTRRQMVELKNELFNSPNAPVSYPYLWDVSRSDYLSYNGFSKTADHGVINQSIMDAIGSLSTIDWEEKRGFSLSKLISGDGDPTRIKTFRSSININNILRIDGQLKTLKSPIWPEDVLGKLDSERIKRGEVLYNQRCVSCHKVIDRNDFYFKISNDFHSVSKMGTDPKTATNTVTYSGGSGISQNDYYDSNVGKILIEEKVSVAMLINAVSENILRTPDLDKWFVRRWLDWLYITADSIIDLKIEPTIKRGDYDPDTTVNPFASLYAYKARPLNGIWATAPYLHNGSVPTLYDLLLPKKKKGDPAVGEYRPDEFYTGSREFDPEKVGLKSQGYKGSRFLTALRGNSNAGHEFASRTMYGSPNPLAREERFDLLEYLKTL